MNLAIKNASTRWTMPIKEWVLAVNQFAILFDGRVPVLIKPCYLHKILDKVS